MHELKASISKLLKEAEGNPNVDVDFIDPVRHVLSAARIVLDAIENKPTEKITEIYAEVFGGLILHIQDPGEIKGTDMSSSNITIRKWCEICGILVKKLRPFSNNKILHDGFINLLTKTLEDYWQRLGSLRGIFPDPYRLADGLGLLDWNIPETVHEAAERALPYYRDLRDFMETQIKKMGTEPDFFSLAGELAWEAAIELEEISKQGTFSGKQIELFNGSLLVKKYNNRQQAAINLYNALIDQKDQKDKTRWVKWERWAYEDPYGATDHRTRAANTVPTIDCRSNVADSLLFLPQITEIRSNTPKKAFVKKIKSARKQEGLFERVCSIAGENPKHYKDFLRSFDEFLFEEVENKGLRVFEEMNEGTFKTILDLGESNIMRKVVLELYSVMETLCRFTSLEVDYASFLVVPRLKSCDTPASLLRRIGDNWIEHVNYERKLVDAEKVRQIFNEKNNKIRLLTIIFNLIGSYPLLNLYAQLTQGLAQSLSPLWIGGMKNIMGTFGLSSGDSKWQSALETLFFETVFYEFSIRKCIAFPQELLLDVAHICDDPSYAVNRAVSFSEKIPLTEEEMKRALETSISEISTNSGRGTIFRPSALVVDIHSHFSSDLERLVKKYNQAYSEYLEKHSNAVVNNVYNIIFDTKKDPADIQRSLVAILPQALIAFQLNTQLDVLPFLRLTKRNHLERLIIQSITMIRRYGGIKTVKTHGKYINVSTFILVCLLRRHDTLFPQKPDSYHLQTLRMKKEQLEKALIQAAATESIFAASLKGSPAKWWQTVSKDVMNPKSKLPINWTQPPVLGQWSSRSPDLAYIITLRENLDAVVVSLSELFLAWFGLIMFNISSSKALDLEVQESVKALFPEADSVALVGHLQHVSKVFKPRLAKLAIIAENIRHGKEPCFDQTDPEQVEIHKTLLDLAREEFPELEEKASKKMKVLGWSARSGSTYHPEEIKIVKSTLDEEARHEVEDVVSQTLWSNWRKTLY